MTELNDNQDNALAQTDTPPHHCTMKTKGEVAVRGEHFMDVVVGVWLWETR